MKRLLLIALVSACALLFALSVAAFAQGAAPTPTPDAMMMQATATPDAMMMQATATPAAMMDHSGAMMAGTATPAAMMAPSTLPVTGGSAGFPWWIVLAAGATALLAGFGLRLSRAAH